MFHGFGRFFGSWFHENQIQNLMSKAAKMPQPHAQMVACDLSGDTRSEKEKKIFESDDPTFRNAILTTMADLSNLKDALGSVVDVMKAMALSIYSPSKVEETNCLVA